MSASLIPMILAGGKGTRFWPVSRAHRPKQFLALDGGNRSLLQVTGDRLTAMGIARSQMWVVTSEMLAAGVREQMPEVPCENVLVEPQGRDTAPAVAWATLTVAERYGDDAIVGFFPADHWIADTDAFARAIDAATKLAASTTAIVTLGMAPSFASTGYGYIERGTPVGEFAGMPAYRVSRFTEKPDGETARAFLDAGCFSWNSGMFVFRAGVALAELDRHAPEILQPLRASGKDAYATLPKNSIDYALMEKTAHAYVLPAEFGWDDLGDWNALERLFKGDRDNVELAIHVGRDTKNSIFYASDSNETIATIGLEDIVVVRDRNVTLVAHKSRTQEIKKLLQQLQTDARFQDLL
ncbi:mannose-1-phosphate guanylyltransferase [Rubidibacter lacunae KORDI 51-2]|uniref:mannose-1-phosphate guanylyltransferase n=1 Tax=Rubidibacter lacunae KORDI 51-2 TaxID=582515 RepID=U5DI86_9CHRO|nr:mannose-1-phosphate guanylyltransferase [Rubidibacter lacunae]ERN40647.1 mannose-1-phosphate guanylyltransferase [Rubidibacter lacunae KORDI 51-2]